ncbi:MAG: PilN domain-containing protein [Gammaproteobacteria bacterium]|nr:PilN domain-containing protein [Gammaproteobacteria bacterium]
MPRINLLPHRAELRTKRRNQFFIGLGVALGAAGLAVLASNLVMDGIIGNQNERNDLLKAEITALDKRIEEILDLEAKKERLLARMEIIEQLQRSRPEIVHVFDELVRTLPDGVRLTSVKQSGRRLEIKGDAESNTRVSAFMRNIDKSKWLTQPDLEVVEVRAAGTRQKKTSGPVETGEFAGRSSQFTVYANQVTVTDEEVAP